MLSEDACIVPKCRRLQWHTGLRRAGHSRIISWTSSETTETINGVVPITSCPAGKYRGDGSSIYSRSNGQRIDGCQFCPRGTYGDSSGLTSAVCSGPCPKGRYRDQKGAVNENDCFLCPPGKVRASVTPHHLADKIMSCYSRLLLLFRFVFMYRSATSLVRFRKNAMGIARPDTIVTFRV